MTKREIIDHCLTHTAVYEDYPFDETYAIVRHSTNKKIFGMIGELNGRLQITLKCDPLNADFLRGAFADVIPGYHMNKQHWNTVFIGGDVPMEEIYDMIRHSYDLTKPKRKNRGMKTYG
ncbi:MAG: MmcQ/YjbR family DNA-binding protein [Defluviitaleaceae bacterium]|nr:MmcQ/YjbR family DNA-binding protein [Defluviitaleaceae bacterium]MCL2262673.1 MmcQ/YjbR family DNA-binding protein [Defluviitaleaceae bacterium]